MGPFRYMQSGKRWALAHQERFKEQKDSNTLETARFWLEKPFNKSNKGKQSENFNQRATRTSTTTTEWVSYACNYSQTASRTSRHHVIDNLEQRDLIYCIGFVLWDDIMAVNLLLLLYQRCKSTSNESAMHGTIPATREWFKQAQDLPVKESERVRGSKRRMA